MGDLRRNTLAGKSKLSLGCFAKSGTSPSESCAKNHRLLDEQWDAFSGNWGRRASIPPNHTTPPVSRPDAFVLSQCEVPGPAAVAIGISRLAPL